MRVKRLVCALFLAAVAPAWASVDLSPLQIELGANDRATVERKACVDQYGVAAVGAVGLRYVVVRPKGATIGARVVCARHVNTPDYGAYYVVYCQKGWIRWSCDEGKVWLEADFLGRGAFEIEFEDLDVESAAAALACLARGIQQQDMLNIRRRGVPRAFWRVTDDATKTEQIEVQLDVVDECVWLHLPLSCADSEQVPITVKRQGCIE